MNILGLSGGFHDAAAAVVSPTGEILFAAHSERYSKKKNDPELDPHLLKYALSHGVSSIAWYERPWMHNLQQWRSGQKIYGAWTTGATIRQHMGTEWPGPKFHHSFPHHLSHAAAGFQTSPFDRAAVVVIDAIGELDTISIYRAAYDDQGRAHYEKMWRQRYPHSIGLFYSAITKAVGLKPMDEEYITMGMAAYGNDLGAGLMKEQFIADVETAEFKKNLHTGFDEHELSFTNNEDIAAAAQRVTEEMIMNIIRHARRITGCDNLVYMGGVALNCVANTRVGQIFDRIWIMPNPGDAGSSLGAAALAHGGRLRWNNAYLGYNIPGSYPIKPLLDHLIRDKIVGVASGQAEFGPRALGNRSLLADPRGWDIKDKVNTIKQRQKFRPFAPVIMEELAKDYFVKGPGPGWDSMRYMQYTAYCREPDNFPAICHVDGTSRVQTVPPDGSGLRRLLEQWYLLTGCPMLLNTSLNIRGEPMVNDRDDARRFQNRYGVTVCS